MCDCLPLLANPEGFSRTSGPFTSLTFVYATALPGGNPVTTSREGNPMRRLARPIGLLSVAGGLVLAAPLTLAPSASAASTVPVTFDCQARPPIGSPQQLTLSTSIQADAPETVAAGGTFEATLAPDPMTVPTTAGGYSVNNLRGLDRKSTRLNSSHELISYAVFCLKKKIFCFFRLFLVLYFSLVIIIV